MDLRLLDVLVCPENHSRLNVADDALLVRLNQAIAEGRVKNRSGKAVTEPLHGGLVREDHALLYAVVEGIPVMLVEEAIPLNQIA